MLDKSARGRGVATGEDVFFRMKEDPVLLDSAEWPKVPQQK